MPDFEHTVAAAVRAERSRLNLRQLDLAQQLDWSLSQVSDLERNKRAIHANDLPRLCRALKVGLDELVKRADPEDLVALMMTSDETSWNSEA